MRPRNSIFINFSQPLMDRQDRWMDAWTDGRTDGWMDGWTDGRKERMDGRSI